MPDHVFEAIGTQWTVRTEAELDARTARELHVRAETFDATYSRFRPDSVVSRFARNAGSCRFPADAGPLFDFYRRLYDATDGAVTPLVGRALEHLGYDAYYRLRRRPGGAPVPAWEGVLTVNGSVLTATRSVMLDVGAAGKGYLVDLLATLLDGEGIESYLIDGSGELVHRGSELCRVGLEDPADPGRVLGVANLANRALSASATNRRRWGPRLHHIIDPATGEPVDGVLATWVLADSAMVADGLATALFLTDPAVLAQHFSFSYVRLLPGRHVEHSTDFDGELFT